MYMTWAISTLIDLNLHTHTHTDEYVLRRFLGARQFDVQRSKKMWIDYVAWRARFGADTILEETVLPPDRTQRLLSLFPHGLHGVDKMVWLIECGVYMCQCGWVWNHARC